jgi:aminocarboxymuconate-semialdehyde decarboxylase
MGEVLGFVACGNVCLNAFLDLTLENDVLGLIIIRPSETALAILSLTCSGTLNRFPNLKICFAHAGGSFPTLLGRIQHGYNCRPDLIATNSGGISPAQHLASGNNIWIDSLVHDPDLLEYLCKKIPKNRILMGSDYPFPLGEVPVAGQMLAEVDELGEFLTWDDRAMILAGNAIQFFGLETEFGNLFSRRLEEFRKVHRQYRKGMIEISPPETERPGSPASSIC